MIYILYYIFITSCIALYIYYNLLWILKLFLFCVTGKLKHAGTSADILQQQLQLQQQALVAAAGAPIPTLTDGIVNVIQSSANSQQQQQQQLVDTSQPPPIRPPTSAALLPPPNTQLQMMPPAFTMPGVPREFTTLIFIIATEYKAFTHFF